MSAELRVVNTAELAKDDKEALDASIDALIAAHKNNRQEINRLVFESVAAMTAGDDYERQLANKKGLRRFLGGITGSNKKLQDLINSNRAAAQYVSQQTLQRLAEQNLMSFDLIAAVNNKLNASINSIECELNQIYDALLTFFKQSRSNMVQLESRIERLEQNVNLLNWQNSIEYQIFDGVEYSELDIPSRIVCIVRDFYDITKGNWTTSDLLLLKTAMNMVDLSPRRTVSYRSVISAVAHNSRLMEYFTGGKQIERLPETYLVPLLGIKKMESLENEERFVTEEILETLHDNGVTADRKELCENLMCKYLQQESQIDVNAQVSNYDLILELLFNLREAEATNIFCSNGQEQQIDVVDETDFLEKQYQRAAELYKNCELKEAHPLLQELSERGFARANGLLYWILDDGYKGVTANHAIARQYVTQGLEMKDALCAVQYAYYCSRSRTERIAIYQEYKPSLISLAKKGDAFAAHMLGLCYLRETDEPIDCRRALKYMIDSASQNYYMAFGDMSDLFKNGKGVEKNLITALAFEKKALSFPQNVQAIASISSIYYSLGKSEEAYKYCCHYNSIGCGRSYSTLGAMYYNGQGVEQNYEKALEWFEKGAALGDGMCFHNLGIMYQYGCGVQQNYQRAINYYLQGGDTNSGICFARLGNLYESGEGVQQNYQKAIEYYQKGAELGDDWCINSLGLMYELGKGLPEDLAEAAKHYLVSAKLGNEVAQCNLAYCYLNGRGVSCNRKEAERWLRVSAAQGHERAKKMLHDEFAT